MNDLMLYRNTLGDIPIFLEKYLDLAILKRLKNITYFCGMDYASKTIYDFKYSISRYFHSLNVALLTYKFTGDKPSTLAGLFHDIATPIFSHVIDYMYEDYATQEYTENRTTAILSNCKELTNLLLKDNLNLEDLDFKKYSLVDNNRPKMCMDRLDGIILTSLAWTKELSLEEVGDIINSLRVYKNSQQELEIGFNNLDISQKMVRLNNEIDRFTHTKEDFYMMNYLAKITKYLITNNYLTEDDLYIKDEKEILKIIKELIKEDQKLAKMWHTFTTIKPEDITIKVNNQVKVRKINPLVNNIRYEELL